MSALYVTAVRHERALHRTETLIRDYWGELHTARVTRPRPEALAIEQALRDLLDVRRELQGRGR